MSDILTASDIMMCPHGGQVSISALQSKASGGALAVRPDDVFMVSGCPLNIAGAPHPCLTVEWQMPSKRVKAGSSFVLTTSSIGLCKAGDQAPQGTVLIQQNQTKAGAQ
jgi:hypothetical protein